MVHNTWTMRQSSSELLGQGKELERIFLNSLSSKGVFHPHVQKLCHKIRHICKSLILGDHEFAEAYNVEQSLWQLHYKQIERFRNHISCFMTSDSEKDGFRIFLLEASEFYQDLISKLRTKYGLSLDLWDVSCYDMNQSAELNQCKQSCYRCLVTLGDYARYKGIYFDNELSKGNFSIAADFYRKAIAHCPTEGQPHNQLAVIAVHVGDEVLAVYHHFRSLAVEKPFLNARENLTIVFDKNRVKYEQHMETIEKYFTGSKISQPRAVKPLKRDMTCLKPNELADRFLLQFVRLNGLLFTKTSLEKFDGLCTSTLTDLDTLLEVNDKEMGLALSAGNCFGIAPKSREAFGPLSIVTILISTIENIKWGSIQAEASLVDMLYLYSFTAFFGIVGRFIQHCANTDDVAGSPLLPSILVALEWLACQSEILKKVDACNELSYCFWKHCVLLLNRCCDIKKQNTVLCDNLDSCVGVAIWEDFELQGFFPLASSHVALLISVRPDNSVDVNIEKDVRIVRLLTTGKAIASMGEVNLTGIGFSERTGEFHHLGNKNEKKLRKYFQKGRSKMIYRPIEGRKRSDLKKCEEGMTKTEPVINKEKPQGQRVVSDDEDDDDEVIVYQPAIKEKLGPNSLQLNTISNDASKIDISGVIDSSMSCSNSLPVKPSCNFKELSSCLPSLNLNCTTVSLEGDKGVSRVPSLTNQSFFVDSLKDQRVESIPFAGPRKPVNKVGVIGPPKQFCSFGSTYEGIESGFCNIVSSNNKSDEFVPGQSKLSPASKTSLSALQPPPGFAPLPFHSSILKEGPYIWTGGKEQLNLEKHLGVTPLDRNIRSSEPPIDKWNHLAKMDLQLQNVEEKGTWSSFEAMSPLHLTKIHS